MKRKAFLLQVILIICLLVLSATITYGQVCGDADNSGATNIVDALFVAQCYVGLRACPAPEIVDVNCNTSIDIVDALIIAQYYVELIPEIVCCDEISGVFPYEPWTYLNGLASVSTTKTADNEYIGGECQEYDLWKEAYVTSDGAGGYLRVKDPSGHVNNWTTSEGIAYGMIFAVYMDDPTLFDALWNYAQLHFTDDPGLPPWPGGTGSGLMIWAIEPTGVPFDDFLGNPFQSATGPDIDIATALIFAYKKWGTAQYQSDALYYVNRILAWEVESNTYVLKPSDGWGGSSCTTPSYFSTASLKIFSDFDITNSASWLSVRNKCYEILFLAQDNNTGLIPDWCSASGIPGQNPNYPTNQTHYYYDAIKAPLIVSLDFVWYGETRSLAFCKNIIDKHFKNEIDPQNNVKIWNGYTLAGDVIGDGEDIAFTGTAGAAAMAASNKFLAAQILEELKDFKMNKYYQDTMRLLSLLRLTGNYPNLYTRFDESGPLTQPDPTPVREDPCPTETPPAQCVGGPLPTALPPLCPSENIVASGCFDNSNDISSWMLDGYGGGAGTITWEDGTAHIDVITPATQEWSVQITQWGIGMKKGTTYILSFDARSDVEGRPMNINIGEGVVPYGSYSGEYTTTPELTCDWQTYSIEFTPTLPTTSNARFEINVGKYMGDVYLDNIICIEKKSMTYPYNPYKYANGLASVSQDQVVDNNFIGGQCTEYDLWKETYVTSDGAGGFLRVKNPQGSPVNCTVSEGIGYGMLLAVYMDDTALLDALWNYALLHLDGNGLMHWEIDKTGMTTGSGSASDADLDMAAALVFANKKWGLYGSDATTLINNIYDHDVEVGTYVLKPGDLYGGSALTNPSCFATSYMRIFADYTSNPDWLTVVSTCYDIIEAASDPSTGLIPNWCQADGLSGPGIGVPPQEGDYYYDAMRVPWRIAIDYLWYGEPRALAFCTKITDFFQTQIDPQGRIRIWNGYALDGSVIGEGEDVAFTGTAGAASMAASKLSLAESALSEVKDFEMNEYFQDTLRILCLLLLTGNYPNLYNIDTTIPEPAPTPIRPVPCPTETPPPLCSSAADPTTVPAACPAENIVAYGCFDSATDLASWTLFFHGGANAVLDWENGTAEIQVIEPGTQDWSIQVTQWNINMEKGVTYNLSFDARTNVIGRPITINIGEGVVPYGSYSGEYKTNPELTCDWQTYNIQFTSPLPDNTNARFEINVGGSLGNVYLDNIILTEQP